MRSLVTSLARKVLVPAALALGALVAAPSVGPAPAQAAPGVAVPVAGIAVGTDPAIVPVNWRRRPYRPYYYAPPRPYYYGRPAYGPRYYAPRPYYRPYYRPHYRPYYYR